MQIKFIKNNDINPILSPDPKTSFFCPVSQKQIHWEEKDVFNPSAVVKDGKIYLIYRAEDSVGHFAGTSRLGLAVSNDGIHFERRPEPIFYPDNDSCYRYEWDGGVEDPRIVKMPQGGYVMTYTGYDGNLARLMIATSEDLIHWEKKGLAFKAHRSAPSGNGKYQSGILSDIWSKSGAILVEEKEGEIVATKLHGKYWMYWGESNIYLATSDDLIDWDPVYEKWYEHDLIASDSFFLSAMRPRNGRFDSRLVEPGPYALLKGDKILFLHNSANHGEYGDKNLPHNTYSVGAAIFDAADPTSLLERTTDPLMIPDQPFEITGQVGNVCFFEGLVPFKGKWFAYYGTADAHIAVAEVEISF